MQILQNQNVIYRNDIINLYIEAFSTGLSQQYIDPLELNQYIDMIFENGNTFLVIENKQVLGALLTCPLKYDKSLPNEIAENFQLEKCVYVAEMMVTEQARGKGIGKRLLNEFFATVDKLLYSDAFIRVWEENIGAIGLYRKMGFEPFTTIEQTKMKADGNGTFVMQKIYLHKKLY